MAVPIQTDESAWSKFCEDGSGIYDWKLLDQGETHIAQNQWQHALVDAAMPDQDKTGRAGPIIPDETFDKWGEPVTDIQKTFSLLDPLIPFFPQDPGFMVLLEDLPAARVRFAFQNAAIVLSQGIGDFKRGL